MGELNSYDVTISCMVYASKTVRVKAKDEDDAEERVTARALAGSIKWEVDTDQTDEDYVIVEVEEVE